MRRSTRRGFTLLEVMIAMAILVFALVALLGHEGIAVQMSDYSNRTTQAAMLAQGKLLDIEHMLIKDAMNRLDNCQEGDFAKEGFRNFKWKACAFKMEMNDGASDMITEQFMQLLAGFGLDPSAEGEQGAMAGNIAGQIGMAVGMIPRFLKQLEDQIRKVQLEITWKDAVRERRFLVERFVTALGSDPQNGPPPADGDAEENTDISDVVNQAQDLLNQYNQRQNGGK
ncbi:prepilin-type N-terminal cleavage/methylation domain-containing protein [Myxococcota bacterium]|nr:prepilin-type N-terminal cleavage/methylation domain-containing protein [Myxococcota bacterium]MBU1429460.1 prepilin-type N-terminal cleavage/methylation domain-containing protein [Myxococcota bacterium]MBU1897479.1 prepilin-type N-terminal cleavage/methylation domain-containing protein [Myxococcota bacterium]